MAGIGSPTPAEPKRATQELEKTESFRRYKRNLLVASATTALLLFICAIKNINLLDFSKEVSFPLIDIYTPVILVIGASLIATIYNYVGFEFEAIDVDLLNSESARNSNSNSKSLDRLEEKFESILGIFESFDSDIMMAGDNIIAQDCGRLGADFPYKIQILNHEANKLNELMLFSEGDGGKPLKTESDFQAFRDKVMKIQEDIYQANNKIESYVEGTISPINRQIGNILNSSGGPDTYQKINDAIQELKAIRVSFDQLSKAISRSQKFRYNYYDKFLSRASFWIVIVAFLCCILTNYYYL